jgi:hypothetical protein
MDAAQCVLTGIADDLGLGLDLSSSERRTDSWKLTAARVTVWPSVQAFAHRAQPGREHMYCERQVLAPILLKR